MKMSVHENIIFAHQKVAEKAFKMNSFLIYPFLKILVNVSLAKEIGVIMVKSPTKT